MRLEKFLNRGSKDFRRKLLSYGRNVKKKYGLGLSEYVSLLDLQNGKCGICGATKSYNLHVDHDHVTGKVRGLLCFHCNAALGHLRDNPEVLKKALVYLEGRMMEKDTMEKFKIAATWLIMGTLIGWITMFGSLLYFSGALYID